MFQKIIAFVFIAIFIIVILYIKKKNAWKIPKNEFPPNRKIILSENVIFYNNLIITIIKQLVHSIYYLKKKDMNFIENEISQKHKNYKLLIQEIKKQEETIKTLRKKNTEYQNTIQELKNTLYEKEKKNKRIPNGLKIEVQKVIGKKLYLQKDITLTKLAKRINTNRTYLSRYLNREYGSFYDFLNKYRIEEVCWILKNEEIIVMKKIYSSVGYKSQSAFYKAFKKIKKITP